MVIRIRSSRAGRRGAMTLQLALILVPVVFGLMAFALDLGRIYLIRGELNQAASAMAMAAASQLNGTEAAAGSAAAAANALIDPSQSDSNSYNFGSIVVGQGNSFLNSPPPALSFFADRADAVSGGTTVDGTQAQYVSVSLAADAPLLFGDLFSFGQSHKTSIAALAVAGLSAPLCTACDIDVFAVAQINAADTTGNFGFIPGNLYTFYFDCTGAPPALLTGTTAPLVPYVLINGYNTGSTVLEDQQLFRTGAQGLLPSPYSSTSLSCVAINQAEILWASATTGTCASGAKASVEDALCGLSSRLTNAQPTFCQNNNDLAAVSTGYSADTDTTFYAADDYTSYMGNNRRILTLPIVDTLSALNVQCFRQFLLEPDDSSGDVNNPADANGRFIAMYLGVVAPVKQGRFDGACGLASGPGRVVLQQ